MREKRGKKIQIAFNSHPEWLERLERLEHTTKCFAGDYFVVGNNMRVVVFATWFSRPKMNFDGRSLCAVPM